MRLNTYRCGCGRLETLPHAKARKLETCLHDRPPRDCSEYGPWRGVHPGMAANLPLWLLEERLILRDGQDVVQWRATRGKALITAYNLFDLQKRCNAVIAARRERASGFFAALRAIVGPMVAGRPDPTQNVYVRYRTTTRADRDETSTFRNSPSGVKVYVSGSPNFSANGSWYAMSADGTKLNKDVKITLDANALNDIQAQIRDKIPKVLKRNSF